MCKRLVLGKSEIEVLMSIRFLTKVEKKTECKNMDIVKCCFEYEKFRVYNNYWENAIPSLIGNLNNDFIQGHFYNDINIVINRLMQKELIIRVKRGYYNITEKGNAEFTKRVLKSQEYHEMLLAI